MAGTPRRLRRAARSGRSALQALPLGLLPSLVGSYGRGVMSREGRGRLPARRLVTPGISSVRVGCLQLEHQALKARVDGVSATQGRRSAPISLLGREHETLSAHGSRSVTTHVPSLLAPRRSRSAPVSLLGAQAGVRMGQEPRQLGLGSTLLLSPSRELGKVLRFLDATHALVLGRRWIAHDREERVGAPRLHRSPTQGSSPCT